MGPSPFTRIVLTSSLIILTGVLCAKFNITSRIRLQPWPNLKKACSMVDTIASLSPPHLLDHTLQTIDDQLSSLLSRIQSFDSIQLKLKSSRYMMMVKCINSCDAGERECLIKIIGIPGLSKYYYQMVLSQLARQIGLEFREGDVIMLKRMNAQPNFVETPEASYSNKTYPIFIKFSSEVAKADFLSRIKHTLYEKQDQNFLNKRFNSILTLDKMEGSDNKIQIHGFMTMPTPTLYKIMGDFCRTIKYNAWKENMVTLYQTRYTKHFDFAGTEQLQTEGIIIKFKSRALKFLWMRNTRATMLKRPKEERKAGFTVRLHNHVKYCNRNFTVYIDEHLSTHKKNLFLIARGRCILRKWLHCWTWDGNVFVRKAFNTPTHRIDTFENIDNVIV